MAKHSLARAALFAGALIAGPILVHGYLTRTPRYHFLPPPGNRERVEAGLLRADVMTGEVYGCEFEYGQSAHAEATTTYHCSAPAAAKR